MNEPTREANRPSRMTRITRRGETWVLLTLLVHSLLAVGPVYRPMTFLIGDAPYYASATASLVKDHDLELRNQVPGDLKLLNHQLALGRGGQWYPKHPILVPLLTAPLFWLLGFDACLVMNILMLLVWGLVIYRLARLVAPPLLAYVAVLLTWSLTPLHQYTYCYNTDVTATWLGLLALLLLARGRTPLAGLVWGLALWAKVVNLLWAPVVLLWLAARGGRWGWLRFLLGLGPVLLVIGGLHWHMFGAPWITGYDRILGIQEDGSTGLTSHRDDFDQPMGQGLRRQLLDPKIGLLRTAPLLLLALPWLPVLWRRHRLLTATFLYGVTAYLLFFSRYAGWIHTGFGNRFLLTPVSLAVLPTAAALCWLRDRIGGQPGEES